MTNTNFASLKAAYDRDGFVVMPGYVTAPEVAQLRARAVPLAAALLKAEEDRDEFRHIVKSLHRHDAWFDQQLNDGKHVPLIRHLLNDEVCGASAAWFDRPEGESQGINPHIDAVGTDWTPDMGATLWIALDAVNSSNGCLHYLRGSHKRTYAESIWVDDIDTTSDDVFVAELKPGDAVVHSAVTVHWSGGNTNGEPRRAVSYFYFSAKAQQTTQHKWTLER